jgi:hypothetical protein
MFGHTTGIDFYKMISEGWVILVNLYSGMGFETIHTRLLGTTVINELMFALDKLNRRGWRGKYYLYIDEAGRYANRRLADLLIYKRKAGLRVTLACQYLNQFEDKYVLDAVLNNCKLKVGFLILNREDRDKFVRLCYGGDLVDRDVSYVLSGLKKQYAVFKKPRIAPVIAKIPHVDTVEVPKEDLNNYIRFLYSNPWNFSPKEILNSINDRFLKPAGKTAADTQAPRPGAAPHRKTGGKSRVSNKRGDTDTWKEVS